MDLDELLELLDRAETNLEKLEAVWSRASSLMPSGPTDTVSPESENLCRSWEALLPGLPPIDGMTVTAELPDAEDLLHSYQEAWFASVPTVHLDRIANEPGKQLSHYRFRLRQTRSRATSKRLDELVGFVDKTLEALVADLPEEPTARTADPRQDHIFTAIDEIDVLLSDDAKRHRRWNDLHRHLLFRQVCDWHDIAELDWPAVRKDIERGSRTDSDPLPVPTIDLGEAVRRRDASPTFALRWNEIDDDGFERLLFDLLRGLEGYQNVDWLMKTRAPDKGRDLQVERVIRDSGGTTRTERVLVQAKHWTSKSVPPTEIAATLATVPLWEPPSIRAVIVATSGRFTTDAAALAEKHNAEGKTPFIELWPDSRLEMLLAKRPEIIEHYGLKP